jgi:hypothetical protein
VDLPLSSPWPDSRSARRALSALAFDAAGVPDPSPARALSAGVDRARLAAWLLHHDLAALARSCAALNDPALAGMLRAAAAGAAAGNLAHFASLERIEKRFEAERIPMVLLKGAAVVGGAYRDLALRPMSDLDIWIPDEDMSRAVDALRALGFRQEPGLPDRPSALQRRSSGELVFRPERGEHGLVELHYGAFPGWWIRRVASPDAAAVWTRRAPVAPGRHAARLAPEDAILQTAFHVAVNQFGQMPLRGMMDLAVLSRAHRIDWSAVASRAVAWRLATSIWLVLDTTHRLIGLPGSDAALARLRPSRARRAALASLVTPSGILAGRDLTRDARRHLFMLALIDRPRDVARLIGRTLWPETWWIDARYGRPVGRVAHLWGLVRRGAV